MNKSESNKVNMYKAVEAVTGKYKEAIAFSKAGKGVALQKEAFR